MDHYDQHDFPEYVQTQLIKQPLSISFLDELLFETLNIETWNILIKLVVNKYLDQIYNFWLKNLEIANIHQQIGVLKELCIKHCKKYSSQTSLYIPFMFATFAFNVETLKNCILSSDKKLDICTYAEGIEYVHIFENYMTFLLTMSNCLINKITTSTTVNVDLVQEERKPQTTLNNIQIVKEPITKVKKYKKNTIPIVIRRKVWAKHVGEDIGKTKCHCCGLNNITQLCFSVGHIIPESKGGTLNVDNLLPICVHCNSSCGTNNLVDFISYCKKGV
jgi:hypothetical protein